MSNPTYAKKKKQASSDEEEMDFYASVYRVMGNIFAKDTLLWNI